MKHCNCSQVIWIVLASLFGIVQFSQAFAKDFPVTVVAGDNQTLIDAINDANLVAPPDRTVITIVSGAGGTSDYTFTAPFQPGASSALPPITANVKITSNCTTGKANFLGNSNFRLFEIKSTGTLNIAAFYIKDFAAPTGHGGAILNNGGMLMLADTIFFGNRVELGNGGAIAGTGASHTIGGEIDFVNNWAGQRGGAFSIEGSSDMHFSTVRAINNDADVFGCFANVDTNCQTGPGLWLSDSTIGGSCSNVLLEDPRGAITSNGNTLWGDFFLVDSTDSFAAGNNLVSVSSQKTQPSQPTDEKALCDGFGTGKFISHGFNIGGDTSCGFTDPTDLPGVDPQVAAPDANGIRVPLPGSPAIDSGGSSIANVGGVLMLPCGPVDTRGLGRPQDANGDGVFECDRGGFEVQGGPALTAGQSAAFFDPNRNGEGIFMEMLGNDSVFLAFFTYTPDGSGPAWFIALGKVVGNSVVAYQFLRPVGGVWGAGFDPDAIDNRIRGSLSLVFPSCEGVTTPGRMVYSGDADGGFEPLLVASQRLSTIVNCSNLVSVTNGGLSGAFFDPARSGEGVFVQWLSATSALVIMFTFDPAGNQFWFISDTTSVSGTKITANVLYPASSTRFGSAFNASEVDLQPWGTLVLDYQGCDALTFTATPQIADFTPQTHNYQRLTRLDGTSCPAAAAN